MSDLTVHVLHVEDDPMQRHYLAHHLKGLTDHHFEIRHADGEDEAIAAFEEGNVDLVILDYHLRQGDGFCCLERIRRSDSIVPVIAISGVATAEIAAELIQAGADDYISKKDLNRDLLGRSVRDALARARACRPRIAQA
jgi:DNA-binding response OmpR family regulator